MPVLYTVIFGFDSQSVLTLVSHKADPKTFKQWLRIIRLLSVSDSMPDSAQGYVGLWGISLWLKTLSLSFSYTAPLPLCFPDSHDKYACLAASQINKCHVIRIH